MKDKKPLVTPKTHLKFVKSLICCVCGQKNVGVRRAGVNPEHIIPLCDGEKIPDYAEKLAHNLRMFSGDYNAAVNLMVRMKG